MLIEKRRNARGTRSARATTSSERGGEATDLILLDDERGQRLDDVHAVPRDLAEDAVLVKQRPDDQLGEDARLGALGGVPDRAARAALRAARTRSPTSDPGRARRETTS